MEVIERHFPCDGIAFEADGEIGTLLSFERMARVAVGNLNRYHLLEAGRAVRLAHDGHQVVENLRPAEQETGHTLERETAVVESHLRLRRAVDEREAAMVIDVHLFDRYLPERGRDFTPRLEIRTGRLFDC